MSERTPRMLTTTEAANRLGLSPNRILQAIKNYHLEARHLADRIGGRWLLHPDALPLIEERKGKRGNPGLSQMWKDRTYRKKRL